MVYNYYYLLITIVTTIICWITCVKQVSLFFFNINSLFPKFLNNWKRPGYKIQCDIQFSKFFTCSGLYRYW